MGAAPATFAASGQSVSAVSVSTAAGVITDIGPDCIPGFGMCMSTANPAVAAAQNAPQPCLPVITGPWSPGSASVTIGDVAALDDSSQCVCSWAGTITVSSAGEEATTLQ